MRVFKHVNDINGLLALLDRSIPEKLDAYIIGGANLIAAGILDRETMDIDVISPSVFSASVQRVIEEIARKEGIPSKWINTMPSSDEQFLTDGWKRRSKLFFEGNRLRVFLLGRADMLGLKLAAAIDRAKADADDILAMNPTNEEWEFGRTWARNYDANPNWPNLIDQLIKELRERQRG